MSTILFIKILKYKSIEKISIIICYKDICGLFTKLIIETEICSGQTGKRLLKNFNRFFHHLLCVIEVIFSFANDEKIKLQSSIKKDYNRFILLKKS